MREQINKVKNFGQFLNENVSINFTKNQKKLTVVFIIAHNGKISAKARI